MIIYCRRKNFKKPNPTLDFILKAPAGLYYLHRSELADICCCVEVAITGTNSAICTWSDNKRTQHKMSVVSDLQEHNIRNLRSEDHV